jgi:hypothetical protein
MPYLNDVHLTPGSKITADGKQSAAIANSTDNTGVLTTDDIIENVPATATAPGTVADAALRSEVNTALTAIENNIADIVAKQNQILAVLRSLGIIKS